MRIEIEYDNTIPEIETGYRLNWRKYQFRRTAMMIIVFAVAIGLSGSMVWREPDNVLGWILLGAAIAMTVNICLAPRRARKRLVAVIEDTPDEKYSAVFGEKEIWIETVVQQGESGGAVDKTRFSLATENLCSVETDELFVLFVNKYLIYIFPKRCLEEGQESALREYFEKNGI